MKDEAIAALLSHRSIEEAARALGVDASTLSRWMKDKEFLESLEGAKKLMYTDAIERLREHAGAAATTILKIMVDPNSGPSARLKAAGWSWTKLKSRKTSNTGWRRWKRSRDCF